MAEQQAQWLGNVLLAPRISHYAFAAFAIAAAAAILCLLFFASYTRKARINGWLVPQHGVVRVFSPATGVIVETRAREGALVTRDAPLFVLSTELRSEALGATREEIVRHLKMRRDAFRRERILHERLHVQRMAEVYAKLEALQLEEAFVGGEIELQKKRLKLAEASEARKRALLARGVTSLHTAQLAEEERLNKALDLRDLEREQVETRRERLALEGERSNLPLQFQTEQSEIERQIASLEQQIAEAEANREIVIAAPQDGIVTSIQADVGSSTGTAVPLANIVPSGSKLEAQLFSPSRAIGFVRPGQHVLLRYQAFPYQKFGHYEGEVASVSRSAVSPNELTQHLSGLTSLYGSNEPVYRITVSLERQTVVAYGRPIPLQPGMQLEADILIERRRLIEWVLDPLFTLTGKWRG